MPRFFENTKKKVLIVLFFFIFSNNLFAETLSSSQTNTSTDTIQDYTINTGVTLTIIDTSPGLKITGCLLYTSPSPRDGLLSRMPSSP